ncbi:MAG: SCP2 sterol-binding domain-containing protein [Anaerolineales bacterium]|nr:SCP2 sterol-binding domain-containing protein [Anaerolineales bacterium]
MAVRFPGPAWLESLQEKLNADEKYSQTARNWEGDMAVVIEPSGPLVETLVYYFDLWHGRCRSVAVLDDSSTVKAAFVLKAPYDHLVKILKGELDPMTAMMTRKLQVQGNLGVMMRNVPTVLEFVRCAKENTGEIL